ncbi:MAG: hydroxymethylpyrimidine/phosphomethylpyrimidine kinase [Gammaproteobacteria bacterium]|nr:hydroxymethylpyrimidine/phosphomethylpyrimidine kinase [Gammaproteobacteria bacterium]
MSSEKPVVMCFSGLDPTGGAGIQADIETLFSIGCHGAPVVTALTAQNTQNAITSLPTEPSLLIQQARAILEDIPISCFKIGLPGSIDCVEVMHTLLEAYPDIPVVLDPIASAGGGFEFSSEEILDAVRTLLLPLTTILTPNTDELASLAPTADTLNACANEILDSGCQHILLTGTHAKTPEVVNKLYSTHQDITFFTWPRLEHVYHGSGCTLAAAVAGYLAHKLSLQDAVQRAQRFTWESLSHATRMGFGQHIPNRSFWNKQIQ